ncbi:MAG: hypothetical protein KGM97_02390 [Alphaproteobacteria bacterium]|nr:hypothetical protein [Alphaproteobacteria bacterium]MDE2629817.1 hypothetical protein [Alphaproteobacteria bacterium]
MPLSPKEAAETLTSVEQAARRSAQAFGYRNASPYLILWGLIWVAGYAGTDLRPEYANLIWAVLVVLGGTVSFFLGRHCERTVGTACYKGGWRMLGLFALVFAFMAATYSIMWPVHGLQFGAFPALLVGAIYCGMGLWLGLRFVVTGALVMGLTLVGFFFLREHFMLWMAFVGGGGLILAGVWFRTV